MLRTSARSAALPMKEIVIDPDDVKATPDKRRQIGEEVFEQLDAPPAHFLRHRLICRKIV